MKCMDFCKYITFKFLCEAIFFILRHFIKIIVMIVIKLIIDKTICIQCTMERNKELVYNSAFSQVGVIKGTISLEEFISIEIFSFR
jgi:hypothetical protein